jgi:hypothetical protein
MGWNAQQRNLKGLQRHRLHPEFSVRTTSESWWSFTHLHYALPSLSISPITSPFILPHFARALRGKSAEALTMAGEAEMAPQVLLQLA